MKLEWIYKEAVDDNFVESEEEFRSKPAPSTEIEVLFDLALRGDMRGILNRAKHINKMGKEYGPFARTLRSLAERFEEKKILQLVKAYRESGK